MDFPIFNDLYNKCLENPNDYLITDEIRLTINTLPIPHLENLYLIILHYAVLEKNSINNNLQNTMVSLKPYLFNKKLSLPYKGISQGKGVLYDLDDMPIFLQSIIGAYIKNLLT